jgi:hypothetical protein
MLITRIKPLLTKWNLLIIIILLLAFILRIYRISELLDFHYDQGRDAKVIWDLWHNHKFFLIGPVTGLDGVFLGPFYYYLIAPFYLIGGGNPAIPSIFLSVLVTASLFVLYKTGELIGDKKLGLLALIIGSFSNFLIMSSRWLSNPTPIYLTSISLFYCLLRIVKENKNIYRFWYLAYLFAGLSFHFEAASAFFYLPILLVFTIWQRKKINKKTFIVSSVLLFLTFLPQIIFELKHGFIISKNILNELPKTEENTSTIFRILSDRAKLLADVVYVKLFPHNFVLSKLFAASSVLGIILTLKGRNNHSLLKLFSIFLGLPFIGYMAYRGHQGILYDYYLTGYYQIIVLFFAYGLWFLTKYKLGKLITAVFMVLFLINNFEPNYKKLTTGAFDGQDIFISNQLAAISWIYQDSRTESFNVDVYVPPVIPHSYDYLLLWNESYKKDFRFEREKQTNLLYTLYEIDPPHPERLEAWLARQKGIGKIEYEESFGGVVVQRRQRIK